MSGATDDQINHQDMVDEPPRAVLGRVEQLRSVASGLLDHLQAVGVQAQQAYEAERTRIVQEQLARMPLDALKTASERRLRLGAMETAGLRTVAAVMAAGSYGLQSIPGVGEKTSVQALAAARQIETALHDVTRVRFDVDGRPDEQTKLLARLREWEVAHRLIDPLHERLDKAVAIIGERLGPARLETRRVRRFFSGRQRKEEARLAFERLAAMVSDASTVLLAQEMSNVQSGLSRRLAAQAL